MSSAGSGSTTPPITVPIQSHVTNPKEISDEIYKAFMVGLNKVMQSGAFKKGMVNTFNHLGKTIEKAMAKSGKTIASEITKSLGTIPKSAQGAAKGAANAFSHMIPHSVQASVDRLTKQFDRLDAVIAGLGKPNAKLENTLAQLNKSIARTTTEASRQQIAAQNSAAQKSAALANASAKQRVAILTAVMGQVRALERGLGSAIKFSLNLATKAAQTLANAYRRMGESARAGSRAAISAIKSITTAIAGVTRAVARMATGLASGFARGFGKISSALTGALRRDEGALRSSLSRRERMVSSSASRQGSLLSRVTSGQALAGIAGGAGLGSILSGGFERFANIERLQFQFERLLGSEAEASAMLEKISQFARTTSFDLTGVAGLATNFVAMGQSADQTMQSIQSLADVTAFAGGNTESLERIQRALGQIVSTGKLQGDELNQLAENLPGINIRQIIADQLGVSTAELVAMQEAGELDAETFINAFLTGIDDPRFNGAAQEIAKTLSGRLANLKETFDVFGASLVGLVADPLRNAMEDVTGILTNVGDFISGEMFKPKAGAENPFAEIADDAKVMFEDLPAEWQKQLEQLGEGWGPGMWVSGADAKAWWENTNAPEADEALERLEKLRDILGDFAKGAGGFLAVAGGMKFFAAALGFLISPLTIITVLFGALSAMWGQMVEASPGLATALSGLRQGFGRLQSALKNSLGIVTSLLSTALFGDSNFFGNLGDKASEFIQKIGYLVNMFDQWVRWANRLTKEGRFDEVFASANQNIQGFIASILGLTDAQQAAAQALGGNDFGNIFTAFLDKLGNVPVLGPIIRFVRRIVSAISRVVGAVGNVIGDLWNTLFGGGGDGDISGPGGMFRAMEDQIAGGQSESQSIGTRLLNRLEDTFLGPVVRFFRGPFADAIEGAGQFVSGLFTAIFGGGDGAKDQATITRVADFLSENGFKGLIEYLRGDGLQTAWDNVYNYFAPMVETVWSGIQKAHDIIAPIVKPLTDWIDDIVEAFKTMDFSNFNLGKIAAGAGAGLLAGAFVAGPVGALAGGLIGAAFGAGLGGAIANTVGNIWTMQVEPALAGLWRSITKYVTGLFTADNLVKALDGLRGLGEMIANILTDPTTLFALLGAAAALTAALTALLVGAFQGVAQNVFELTNIIAGVLQSAWEGLADSKLEFVPDPIKDAISAVLGNPATTAAALVAMTLLGVNLVKALVAGVTTLGPALGLGGKGIIGAMLGKQLSPKIGIGEEKIFNSKGAAIASAIVAGIGAFEFSRQAGKTGSGGNMLLAILSGTATGAMLGFSVGGPLGAVIGGALGAGISGIGAAIGASGREADDAAAKVDAYAEALAGIRDRDDIVAAGAEQVRTFIGEADQDINDFLVGAEFNASEFFRSIVDGSFTVQGAVADVFKGLGENFTFDTFNDSSLDAAFEAIRESGRASATDIRQAFSLIGSVVDANDVTNLEQLQDIISNMDGVGEIGTAANTAQLVIDQLADKGLDLQDIFEILGEEGVAGLEGVKEAANEIKLADLSTEAEGVASAFESVEDAVAGLIDKVSDGAGVAEIEALLNTTGFGTQEKLETLAGIVDDLKTQIDDARESLVELLDQSRPDETVATVRRGFQIELPDWQDQLDAIMGEDSTVDVSVRAQVTAQTKDEFQNEIVDLLQGAVDSGSISSQSDWDTAILGLLGDVDAAVAAETISATFGEELKAMIGEISLTPEVRETLDAIATDEATLAAARAAAQEVADTFHTSLNERLAETAASTPYGIDAIFGERGNESGVGARTVRTPTADSGAADSFISEMGFSASNVTTVVQRAISDGIKNVNVSGMKNLDGGDDLGRGLGEDVARGVESTRTKVQSSIRGLTAGVQSKASSGEMFWIGVAMGQGLVNGLNAMLPGVQAAAARLATAAANATKKASGIRSPSKVFIEIGHQIGAGFVQGIEDSTVSMTDALTTAITTAIEAAVEAGGDAVRQAKAGQAIFEALFPSTLPGGATLTEIMTSGAGLTQSVGGFGKTLRGNIDLGALGDIGLTEASQQIQGMALDFSLALGDTNDQYKEAIAQQKLITKYQADLKKLNADKADGDLGDIRRARLRKEAYADLLADQDKLNAAIAKLGVDLKAGRLTRAKYNEKVTELNQNFSVTSKNDYLETLQEIDILWKRGTLTAQEYKEQLDKLGDRPDALTREQQNLIASGPTSLSLGTLAGKANVEALSGALGGIREYAQALIDAGQPLSYVVSQAALYTGQLRAQAVAAHLNGTEVDKLIAAYGLTTPQLEAFVANLTDLNSATTQGAANISDITGQLTAIRDFGSQLIASGVSAETAVTQIKAFRDALVSQLTAFGFTTTGITALVDAVGLGDAALSDFTQQMNDFNAAVTAGSGNGGSTASTSNPVVYQTINLVAPYGDPAALGLSVANQAAMSSLRSF